MVSNSVENWIKDLVYLGKKTQIWAIYVTPWTVAHQVPLSMGFSRQEYCSGLPFSSPGDLPDSGIETMSPALAGRFFTTEPPEKHFFF